MLALTADASQAIEGILQQSETATGIRIAPSSDDGGSGQLQMSVVDAPEASDEVIETAGAQVFVEESASPFLQDKVLDATITEDRAIQFEILTQAAE
ncbi:MAG TPA: iron-sulfur cluster biosynthesis family protein [Solirubrobacteraceae bacterium]|nr:iron-sulfur cluster biosynthesis family protein [Solirubrobacteraceae bacterium]